MSNRDGTGSSRSFFVIEDQGAAQSFDIHRIFLRGIDQSLPRCAPDFPLHPPRSSIVME